MMTSQQEKALATIEHGPQGAITVMQIAVDNMVAAIRAGDMAALAKAQSQIHFWADSATFWADAAVKVMMPGERLHHIQKQKGA
jgi:hypothetical protein